MGDAKGFFFFSEHPHFSFDLKFSYLCIMLFTHSVSKSTLICLTINILTQEEK